MKIDGTVEIERLDSVVRAVLDCRTAALGARSLQLGEPFIGRLLADALADQANHFLAVRDTRRVRRETLIARPLGMAAELREALRIL